MRIISYLYTVLIARCYILGESPKKTFPFFNVWINYLLFINTNVVDYIEHT
jgi:hypothetical protein